MSDKEMQKKNRKSELVRSGISALIGLALVIFCIFSFAWFTTDSKATARSITIGVSSIKSLKISTTANGPDITDIETMRLSVIPAGAQISPGDSGSFTVYMTYSNTGTVHIDYILNPDDSIVTDPPYTGNGYRENTSAAAQAKAINFAQSHIALFSSYNPTTKVYSGYINPDEGIDVSLTADTETPVTFYWLWIESYPMISDGEATHINDSTISDDDRTLIMSYMTASPEKWFDYRNNVITDLSVVSSINRFYYFNFADEDIGTGMQYFCYDLTFNNFS